MKLLLFLCFVSIAVAAPRWRHVPYNLDNDIENYGLVLGSDNYRLYYEQNDGTKIKQEGMLRNRGRADEYLVVEGYHSWMGPDGLKYVVTYSVDKDMDTTDKGYHSAKENVYEDDEPEGEAPGAGDAGAALATMLGK